MLHNLAPSWVCLNETAVAGFVVAEELTGFTVARY